MQHTPRCSTSPAWCQRRWPVDHREQDNGPPVERVVRPILGGHSQEVGRSRSVGSTSACQRACGAKGCGATPRTPTSTIVGATDADLRVAKPVWLLGQPSNPSHIGCFALRIRATSGCLASPAALCPNIGCFALRIRGTRTRSPHAHQVTKGIAAARGVTTAQDCGRRSPWNFSPQAPLFGEAGSMAGADSLTQMGVLAPPAARLGDSSPVRPPPHPVRRQRGRPREAPKHTGLVSGCGARPQSGTHEAAHGTKMQAVHDPHCLAVCGPRPGARERCP